MVKREWSIEIDGQQYEIKLEQGTIIPKKKIKLNGHLLEHDVESKQDILGNLSIDFKIGSHDIKIVGQSNGFSTKYDIFVNGVSKSTGQPYIPLPPIPWWLWIFIVACGSMPIISMGGAIPAVLGLGGAAICLSQGRNTKIPINFRILICIGVTIAAWLLYLVLIIGISYLRN
jgi:hypothetical protein